MLLAGEDIRKFDKKVKEVFTFRSNNYPNVVLYDVKRWVYATIKGEEEYLLLIVVIGSIHSFGIIMAFFKKNSSYF